jgi:ABC-type Zn uptake system ZnuABC Zn-binding protein ZnuA
VPGDIQKVAGADVVFYNGRNMEGWIEKLLKNAGGQRPAIALTEGLTPLKDKNGDPDPHMWQSPANAVKYVENVRDGLIEVDPAGAAIYRANAEAYVGKLKELDAWAAEQVATIPAERRKLVMTHDAFQYLADRYGIEVVGSIWGITTQDEPSAQEIGELVAKIRAAGVPAVFVETTVNPKLMEQIARDAGVRIGAKVYAESLAPKGEAADSYLGLVRTNVKAFVEGLK